MKQPASMYFLILSLLAAFAAAAESPGLKAYESFFKTPSAAKDCRARGSENHCAFARWITRLDNLGNRRPLAHRARRHPAGADPRDAAARQWKRIGAYHRPGRWVSESFHGHRRLGGGSVPCGAWDCCFALMYRLDDTPADIDGYGTSFRRGSPTSTPSRPSAPCHRPRLPWRRRTVSPRLNGARPCRYLRHRREHIGFIGFSAGGITAMNVDSAYTAASCSVVPRGYLLSYVETSVLLDASPASTPGRR